MSEELENSYQKKLTRRSFLMLTAGLAAGCLITQSIYNIGKESSTVAIVKVPKYTTEIKNLLKPYFKQFNFNLAGKRVLLKPNLVNFYGLDKHIYTNPDVILAAIELFSDLGAKVVVAEATALRRDINTLLYYSKYKELFRKYNTKFVDLNMDYVEKIRIPTNLTKLNELYIPKTVLDSDFIVSMPKMKTHHWMGITLSLKNMFGIMPGTKYGWPKNRLHTAGLERSVLDINYTIRPHFAIVDGVYGIEGNGPLFGDNKYVGVVVMSNDLLATDFVCAKIMGIDPEKVIYLKAATATVNNRTAPLGNPKDINIIGTSIDSVRQNFKLLDEFSYLRS